MLSDEILLILPYPKSILEERRALMHKYLYLLWIFQKNQARDRIMKLLKLEVCLLQHICIQFISISRSTRFLFRGAIRSEEVATMSTAGGEYTIKSSEKNGLESVIITNGTGTSSVEVLLFGGTLVSWICDGSERIFVSPDALYNGINLLQSS